MKMYAFAAWLLAAALALSGCGGSVTGANGSGATQETPPGMEGYVVAKDNGRVLVVDPVPQNFSETGGVEEFYNAIWFAGAPAHAGIGHRVQVWFDAVAESYPGQSTATKMNVLTSPKPAGADLSEAEAIRAALSAQSFAWPPAISKAEYDASGDVWNVSIRHEGETVDAQVEDRT